MYQHTRKEMLEHNATNIYKSEIYKYERERKFSYTNENLRPSANCTTLKY